MTLHGNSNSRLLPILLFFKDNCVVDVDCFLVLCRKRYEVPFEVNIRSSTQARDALATDVTEQYAALVSCLTNQPAGLSEMSVFIFDIFLTVHLIILILILNNLMH